MDQILVIPARLGSKRLPKKVISEVNGKPLILFLLERLKRCKEISKILIATTTNKEDDLLV